MRPYNRGSDFPTLLALLIAVIFPLLLLSLVFDLFPRDRLDQLLADLPIPWVAADARPTASPTALAVASPSPAVLALATADWPVAEGRFFTQTNGRPPLTNATGFAVTNAGGVGFWDEFQRLGGADAVGYPLSNRFGFRGFTVQVFQKLVFQAPERGGQVDVLNVMDDLSALGKDEWLKSDRLVPLPLGPDFDAGREPAAIPAARLELLAEDPAIEKAYRSAKDPLRQFGLPTSRVTDLGQHLVAIRCQRTVLQHWKTDMPWGVKAGDVTVANAGEMAVEAGLFPRDGMQPTPSAPPQPAGPSPVPSPGPR